MLAEYSGVLILLGVALGIAALMVGVHLALGPRRAFAEKLDPFECGERPIVSPYQRFPVKFYLVAILFILFDVEAVFLYPWGALFLELGWFGFVSMSVFLAVLTVGLIYEWMKGGLEW